jgi:NAD+ diphosphatase
MSRPRFVRDVDESAAASGPALCFTFAGDKLVLERTEAGQQPPTAQTLARHGLLPHNLMLLGRLDDTPCFGGNLETEAVPDPLRAVDLRQAWGELPELPYSIAGYAAQIAHWDRTTHFCPVCGNRTERMARERAKTCTVCHFHQYPRVSPAIIVLIYRPGQILLTRQPSWPPNRYSLVAGFVEAGESLEECLRREVAEEVGVAVDEIRYLGSQPWPFPHQLMVGFLARYHSGEVAIDNQELEHAAWFDLDALPELSPPLSISRRIIDWYLQTQHEPAAPFPAFDLLA